MVTVRDALPADNDALLSLTRATPMSADISLCIEREPDFFALCHARGTTKAVVALDHGRIVGCATSSRRPAFLAGGEVGEVGVIADLKVDPAWRRRGVALALLKGLYEREAGSPAVFLASTAVGNTAMDAAAASWAGPFDIRPLTVVTSRQLFPWIRSSRPPAGVTLRPAADSDRGALTELLHTFYRSYALAPPFRDGEFERLLARSPSLAWSDYRVAERGGRIVAACASWDPHTAKRTRVVAMPWTLRTVAAASWLLPIPSLPAPGGLLRFRYLRHPCHAPGEQASLKALIRDVLVESRKEKQHFLAYTTAAGDPLASLVAGWPSTAFRYRLIAGVSDPRARPALEALTGAAYYYDDAALA